MSGPSNEAEALLATVVSKDPAIFTEYPLDPDTRDSLFAWVQNVKAPLLATVLGLNQVRTQLWANEQAERKVSGSNWPSPADEDRKSTAAYTQTGDKMLRVDSENSVHGVLELNGLPACLKPSYFVVQIPSSLKNPKITVSYRVITPSSQNSQGESVQRSIGPQEWRERGGHQYALVMTDSMWPLEKNRELEALLISMHSGDIALKARILEAAEHPAISVQQEDSQSSEESERWQEGEDSHVNPTLNPSSEDRAPSSSSSSSSSPSSASSRAPENSEPPSQQEGSSLQSSSLDSSSAHSSEGSLEKEAQEEVSITEQDEGGGPLSGPSNKMGANSISSSEETAESEGGDPSVTEQGSAWAGSPGKTPTAEASGSSEVSASQDKEGPVDNSITSMAASERAQKAWSSSSTAAGEGPELVDSYASEDEESEDEEAAIVPEIMQASSTKKKDIEAMAPFLSILAGDRTITIHVEGQTESTIGQTVLVEFAGLSFEKQEPGCGGSA